ncbi:MAG: Ribosomal RNA small subunit methyltransferase B [Holosporales bacterium]
MKNLARLKAITELLSDILNPENRKPADDLFVNYCRSRRYIGSKDRQFLSDFFFNILRFYEALQHALKGAIDPRMLALTYWYVVFKNFNDLDWEEDSPYCIRSPNFHEKEIIIKVCKVFDENPYIIPEWCRPFFETYGQNMAQEIEALFKEAPFDIRINPLLTKREELLKDLKKQRIQATPTSLSPFGIRLKDRVPLQEHTFWKDGKIEIQDEGAQLVSLLSDVKPGQNVLDYCAGAGGKTLLLAALMNNKGRLIATDLHKKRLEQGQKRYHRARVFNVQIKDIDDSKWWKRHASTFDRVLIDVPCSGSGTWRRNPDLKLRFKKHDLKELLNVQQSILKKAKDFVKTDGYLIYATCSMWSCENEQQIKMFLNEHQNFKLMDIKIAFDEVKNAGTFSEFSESKNGEDGFLQLTPNQHNVDGFFIAVLKKVDSCSEQINIACS